MSIQQMYLKVLEDAMDLATTQIIVIEHNYHYNGNKLIDEQDKGLPHFTIDDSEHWSDSQSELVRLTQKIKICCTQSSFLNNLR